MGKKKNGHSATETCDKYSFANKGPIASDELGVSREPAIDFESCEGVRDADKGIIWYDGLPTFNEIRSFLDKTIIGQDEAKDMAALLLADHMRGTTHTFLVLRAFGLRQERNLAPARLGIRPGTDQDNLDHEPCS